MCCLLFRPFLMWLFKALESSGLSNSKLQSSSDDTDMTAPQLSNSPQYCIVLVTVRLHGRGGVHTFGALKTVTKTLSVKNS